MIHERKHQRGNDEWKSAEVFHLVGALVILLVASVAVIVFYVIMVIDGTEERIQQASQIPPFVFGNAVNESAISPKGDAELGKALIATVAFGTAIPVSGDAAAVIFVKNGLKLVLSRPCPRKSLLEAFHKIPSLPQEWDQDLSQLLRPSLGEAAAEDEVSASCFTAKLTSTTPSRQAGRGHPKTVDLYMSLRSDPRELRTADLIVNDQRLRDGQNDDRPFRSLILFVVTWVSRDSDGAFFQLAIASDKGGHEQQQTWAILSSSMWDQIPDAGAGSVNVALRMDKLGEIHRFTRGESINRHQDQHRGGITFAPWKENTKSWEQLATQHTPKKHQQRRRTWQRTDRQFQKQLDSRREQILRGKTTQALNAPRIQTTAEGTSCQDNVDAAFRMFKPNSRRIRSCEWLERRRRRKAQKRGRNGSPDSEEDDVIRFHCNLHDIRIKCPRTCGECKNCNDQPDALFFAYPSKNHVNCTFVAKRRKRRRWVCELEHQPGYAQCPQTCRRTAATCNATEIIPTFTPTLSPASDSDEPNEDGNEFDRGRLLTSTPSLKPSVTQLPVPAIPSVAMPPTTFPTRTPGPIFRSTSAPTMAPTMKRPIMDETMQGASTLPVPNGSDAPTFLQPDALPESTTLSPDPSVLPAVQTGTTSPITVQPMSAAPSNKPTIPEGPPGVNKRRSTQPTSPPINEEPTFDPKKRAPTSVPSSFIPPFCLTAVPTTAGELTDVLTNKIIEATQHSNSLKAVNDALLTTAPTSRCDFLIHSPTTPPKTPNNSTRTPTPTTLHSSSPPTPVLQTTQPTASPTLPPTITPSSSRTVMPTPLPSSKVTPISRPTQLPTAVLSTAPSVSSSVVPSAVPAPNMQSASMSPSSLSPAPLVTTPLTSFPMQPPTAVPPPSPSVAPSIAPTTVSGPSTQLPSISPSSLSPTQSRRRRAPPTFVPTKLPTPIPSTTPSFIQSAVPNPSSRPSMFPSPLSPTPSPRRKSPPRSFPTAVPTAVQSQAPSEASSEGPSSSPTSEPSVFTRAIPTVFPSEAPTSTLTPTTFKARSLPFEFGNKVEGDVANTGSEPFIMSSGVNFLGGIYTTLFQNVHGHITFNIPSNQSDPVVLPSPSVTTKVAAFWTAIASPSTSKENNKGKKTKPKRNRLFVGLRNDTETVKVAETIIAQASSFPFTSIVNNNLPAVPIDNVFVATWSRVSQFNGESEKTNTFQASLAFSSLGTTTWVILGYEEMEWAQLGNLGNPGTIVGLNGRGRSTGGATIANMEFPTDIQRLQQGSNIDLPGTWVFRVDR